MKAEKIFDPLKLVLIVLIAWAVVSPETFGEHLVGGIMIGLEEAYFNYFNP